MKTLDRGNKTVEVRELQDFFNDGEWRLTTAAHDPQVVAIDGGRILAFLPHNLSSTYREDAKAMRAGPKLYDALESIVRLLGDVIPEELRTEAEAALALVEEDAVESSDAREQSSTNVAGENRLQKLGKELGQAAEHLSKGYVILARQAARGDWAGPIEDLHLFLAQEMGVDTDALDTAHDVRVDATQE